MSGRTNSQCEGGVDVNLDFVVFHLIKKCMVKTERNKGLGTGHVTKLDEFSEKFQTAFDPSPPHFRKVTLRFSRQNCDKSAYVHMEGLLCII